MFRLGCVRSLSWPRNHAAIAGCEWDIYTRKTEISTIARILDGLDVTLNFHALPRCASDQELLLTTLAEEAARCVADDAAMFTAQPDNVFGEGSIATMRLLAEEAAGTCVAQAHPRVNIEPFLAAMPEGVLSNPKLVSLAMDNLHASVACSDLAREETASWHGGMAWRRLGPDLYGVTSHLPSILMARMTAEDVEFLTSAGDGAWDHAWPATLMDSGRQRFIGSSDAAFAVELTDPRRHGPVLRARPSDPTAYQHGAAHHVVNRNTVAVWRGIAGD